MHTPQSLLFAFFVYIMVGVKFVLKHLVTLNTFQLSTAVKLMSHSLFVQSLVKRNHLKAAGVGAHNSSYVETRNIETGVSLFKGGSIQFA